MPLSLGWLLQVKILGKCEFANPSGSIKDRIADHILTTAEQEGKLKSGGTVVAATSGNTGASVAMIAAMKGYHYIGRLCCPSLLYAFSALVIMLQLQCTSSHLFFALALGVAGQDALACCCHVLNLVYCLQ